MGQLQIKRNTYPDFDLDKMSQSQRNKFLVAMEMASWNLARGDAVALCYRLEREIQKRGGARQRGEGLKWLKRIKARLYGWVK